MFRGKGWFSTGMWKPKNLHSLEHLKYLYHVLYKNQIVNEQNKGLLVETLRSIAEILIWGDQNDSTVFDFFLEKNMLSFFLKIMKQKCGRYVCVQLLQTLNILFENIRNETSLYYLLSNNHVNSIIIHKFDFSDEEVMAYYISFLKTLSLKLNTHTIHFFYNEHTNDFPLYSEAIKFFKHSESMVRIAVRTLTLNVFKVDDKAMLKFIRDKTAAPYFSNLVWFIGEHVMELDRCVQSASDLQVHTKLSDLVAEHLDHLHYLNDILCLRIDALNDVLTDHLLYKLLIPLYVYSLVQKERPVNSQEEKPRVSSIVSLFLLSQVFLIVSHRPLVHQLANIIINGDFSLFSEELNNLRAKFNASELPASETNSTTLNESDLLRLDDNYRDMSLTSNDDSSNKSDLVCDGKEGSNITDEEKVVASRKLSQFDYSQMNFSLSNRPFLEAVFLALECSENDHATLFALCVLYALGHNPGVNQVLLDTVLMPSEKSKVKLIYNVNLIERMILIISQSCQYSSKVRIASLQMTILLLKQLVVKETVSYLQDRHLAAIEQCREESTLMLRNFYKSEEIFLDMFEDEYEEMKKRPLNVEYLMMDANLLLPPTATPMSGIEFHKRLPCGEVERARRAIRVFFLLRDMSLTLQNTTETQLPLTNIALCIKVNDALDLTNSDLICCTVITKDGQKIKPFMVIDTLQLILVEPDSKRLGWGIAKFVGFLQDIEVTGDKDDSRCLHITVHRPSSIVSGKNVSPLLAAKFVFDDHIRCMAAKQRLSKGRQKARQRKLHQIARLLELPEHIQPCPSPLRHGLHSVKNESSLSMHRSQSQDTGLRGKAAANAGSGKHNHCHHRPLATPSNKVPGHAALTKHCESRNESVESDFGATASPHRRTSSSPSMPRRHVPRLRDSSPRQRVNCSSEEIPLEDLSRNRSTRHGSPSIRRRSTPGLPQARISAPPGICHVYQHYSTSQLRSSDSSRSVDSKTNEVSDVAHKQLLPETDLLTGYSVSDASDTNPETIASKLKHNLSANMLPALLVPVTHSSTELPNVQHGELCPTPCCSTDKEHQNVDVNPSCDLPKDISTEDKVQSNLENASSQEESRESNQATNNTSKVKGSIQTV